MEKASIHQLKRALADHSVRVLAGALVAYVGIFLVLHTVGHHVTLPDERTTAPTDGLVVALTRLLGHPGDAVDFAADYASAHALVHGQDAYGISADLFKGLGIPPWPVETANTHPPTVFLLVLPFTLLHFWAASAAFALAMIFALIATLRLVGLPYRYAIPAGVGIGVTFPGAYGIVNVVPLIGLGVALAYRYRYHPVLGGLGVALAAVPKASGLILVLPFLLAGRIRLVLWAVGFWLAAAILPLLWQHDAWSRYATAGVAAVNANAARSDDASLLSLAHHHVGISTSLAAVFVAAVAVGTALARRELFWPTVWAMVATLPIAWMYSLLTLVPLVAWALLRSGDVRAVAVLSLFAAAVTVSSPPYGDWPVVIYPIVVLLVLLVYISARPREVTLWLPAKARLVLAEQLGTRGRTLAHLSGTGDRRGDQ